MYRGHNFVSHLWVPWDGGHFCFGRNRFPDVETLQEHFDNQPVIQFVSGGTDVYV